MELNNYQQLARQTDQRKSTTDEVSRLIPLLGLIGEVGSVASEHKKRLRDRDSYSSFTERFKEELGDILWYVSTLASDFGLELEEIAQANLAKTDDRWGDVQKLPVIPLFDEEYPETERFPREANINFIVNESGRVEMYIEDKQIGDPLSDNAHEEDGYRFHDAFHLSFMAVLGWSPVSRKLLGLKRKSNPQIDEVEDGARAGIVEETIVAVLYEYARERNFLKGIDVIDYEVMATIKLMVKNLEVASLPSALWHKTIMRGFKVYRQLRENNGGKVYLNLNKRTFKFLA